MAEKRLPTNEDIFRTLGQIDEKVDEIKHQVKRTNGRVTTLEKWKNDLDVVEAYKARSSIVPEKLQSPPDLVKVLLGLLVTALGIIATLATAGVIKT